MIRVLRVSRSGSRPWAIVDEHGNHLEMPTTVNHPQLGLIETSRIYFRSRREALAAQDRAGKEEA